MASLGSWSQSHTCWWLQRKCWEFWKWSFWLYANDHSCSMFNLLLITRAFGRTWAFLPPSYSFFIRRNVHLKLRSAVLIIIFICRNSFFLQAHAISSNKSSSRTVLAGSIIGAIANFFLIILFGIRDERFKEVEAWWADDAYLCSFSQVCRRRRDYDALFNADR